MMPKIFEFPHWSGSRFLGPDDYKIFGGLFMKKNTKLGTKVSIHLGPLPKPWKGPIQVRDLNLKVN